MGRKGVGSTYNATPSGGQAMRRNWYLSMSSSHGITGRAADSTLLDHPIARETLEGRAAVEAAVFLARPLVLGAHHRINGISSLSLLPCETDKRVGRRRAGY